MDDDLQISGIQHFNFCRRQWALIHVEQEWADNYFTIDGNILHERVDDPKFTEKRGNIIESRALPVRSEKYGLSGRCDMVEFHLSEDGVPIAARDGLWQPVSAAALRRSTRIAFSSALRRSVLKKCSAQIYRSDISITVRPDIANVWSLMPSFAKKRSKRYPKCVSCMTADTLRGSNIRKSAAAAR